ncbi:hypothetical protein O181_078599, partial [Austropuccinia psidii MF-1]|nr:hypothetical protein [Austropuccinia psidii MF-1]
DICNSIEDEDEARRTFHLLQRRFEKHSWSHVMNLFDDLVNAPEASPNLSESFAATRSVLSNLKSAMGSTWDDETLIAIFFHYRNKQFFHEISTAMDTKVSLDTRARVRAEDILEIAQRFQKRLPTSSSQPAATIMSANVANAPSTSRLMPPRSTQHKPGSATANPAKRIPLSQQSESWAKYHLSPRYPCLHCFEWGHWVQDCHRKKAGFPAVEDPRIKNPNITLKKSAVVSHPCLSGMEAEEEDPFIASIQETPEHESQTAPRRREGYNSLGMPIW